MPFIEADGGTEGQDRRRRKRNRRPSEYYYSTLLREGKEDRLRDPRQAV